MKVWDLMAAMAAAGLFLGSPASARNKDFALQGYALPADKPVTIILIRPDVQVGVLEAGGLPTPNADWTSAARTNMQSALEINQRARQSDFKLLEAQTGEAQQLVGDYEALHRAVANSILEFAYGSKLPTKKASKATGGKPVFDWTMGPGTQKIGDIGGGNYALFLFTRDSFASTGRKAMQVAGALGCIVGFCAIVSGGQHVSYASLVELSTGNIVWFNVQRGSKGDVREKEGAQALIDAIMATMPTKPNATAAIPAKAKRR